MPKSIKYLWIQYIITDCTVSPGFLSYSLSLPISLSLSLSIYIYIYFNAYILEYAENIKLLKKGNIFLEVEILRNYCVTYNLKDFKMNFTCIFAVQICGTNKLFFRKCVTWGNVIPRDKFLIQ